MSAMKKRAIDATIAGLEHSDLWYEFWQHPDSGPALTLLVEAFLPLAQRVMERISIRLPPHVAVDDLFQSALVGLYHSITRFDPSKGVRFETFATLRIRGAILDELRSADHIPRAVRSLIRRIEAAIQQWHTTHHAPPDEEELAREVNLSPSELLATLVQGQPLMSLDSVVMDHGGHSMTLLDILADNQSLTPKESAEREDTRVQLRKAFLKLAAREQKILYLYYFEELRLSEIAELYGLTDARICQIHAIAVAKLRALLGVEQENE